MTLTLEFDEATQRKMEEAAAREAKPVDSWARAHLIDLAVKDADRSHSKWPEGFASLFGAITEPAFAAPRRHPATEREDF